MWLLFVIYMVGAILFACFAPIGKAKVWQGIAATIFWPMVLAEAFLVSLKK